MRGEGEKGGKGEKKHSSYDPRYTNENSALATPNMINCHYAPSCILRLRLLEE